MSVSDNEGRLAREFADDRRREDAALQCKTIVGDSDGFWLSEQIEELQHTVKVIHSQKTRRYHFLDDDAEVILGLPNQHRCNTVIEMPPGATIRRGSGDGFRTWVFKVDNGLSGDANEWFELAYRKISTGAHMLYLRSHHHAP